MGSFQFLLNYRPFLPWICSSLALGYAAYITWKLKRIQEDGKKRPMNIDQDNFPAKHEVNIDTIDRKSRPKKRISYCRCWRSATFPYCDGAHKQHNRENNDKVNALVLVWNDEPEAVAEMKPEEEEEEAKPMDTSIIDHDNDMDIKSIDSESPILQSSNGDDSNGEMEKMGETINISDEHLSSMEMIEDTFSAPTEEKEGKGEENDLYEDTVKVKN